MSEEELVAKNGADLDQAWMDVRKDAAAMALLATYLHAMPGATAAHRLAARALSLVVAEVLHRQCQRPDPDDWSDLDPQRGAAVLSQDLGGQNPSRSRNSSSALMVTVVRSGATRWAAMNAWIAASSSSVMRT